MSDRPPLSTLETIVVAARCPSFSEAAIKLGLTHGAISRRVAALESWLGFPVFERHGRGIRPTPDGQRFVAQLDEAFRQIEMASDRWRRVSSDTVRVSSVPSFAKLWLLPRLRALEARGCRIDLAVEHRNADVERGEVDVAIRYGRGRWPNVDAIGLGAEHHFPVAAAEVVQALGTNPSIEAILARPLIHDSDATGWRAWLASIGCASFKPRRHDRRFEDYTLSLAAAEQGLGIALARAPIADDYVASSKLRRIHAATSQSPLLYYLVIQFGERRPTVRQFIEQVMTEFNSVR